MLEVTDSNLCRADEERAEEALIDWECSLHLPLWVCKTEKTSIEKRRDNFTALLEESDANVVSLAASLRKPLCPLWMS